MSVRPPGSTDDEPEVVEFGIPALAARLDDADVAFPARGEELVRRLDDPDIPVDVHGGTVALSAALDDLAGREFDSERDLLNALHPVLESRRENAASGLLASVRAVLPF